LQIIIALIITCTLIQSTYGFPMGRLVIESDSRLYENPIYGFGVSYPEGWTIKEAALNSQNLVASFLAPGEAIGSAKNYVTVQVESLPSDYPSDSKVGLDQYTSAVISNLQKLEDFKLISNRDITLWNLPGKEILYTMNNGEVPYKILIQYTIKENKAYVISYYAQADTYSKFENKVKDIAMSLKSSSTENIYHPTTASSISLYNSTSSSSSTPSLSYSSSSSDVVNVRGYYRKDGTYVHPHTQSKPSKH